MRSEKGDFNSCGKWSSGVLPIMLWWLLAWFPYFYIDCPWPYCAVVFIVLGIYNFACLVMISAGSKHNMTKGSTETSLQVEKMILP